MEQQIAFVKELDTPLLRLAKNDMFTFRELCAGGVHVFAAAGAGKTSGPGRSLRGGLLRSNAGGIVTAVKPDEISLWISDAVEHGRESSLILLDENEGFNFIDYLLASQGADAIGNVTETLMRLIEMGRQVSGSAGRGGEVFWDDSARQVLRYVIPPVYAATGTVSMSDIIRFLVTAPKNAAELVDENWKKHSFMSGVMGAAKHEPTIPMSRAAMQLYSNYWAEEWACTVPEKTKGNIIATVSSTLDRFRHGRLNKVFCGKTTVVPELTFHGAVILLAMPTLTWHEDGIIGQQLFKYLWQRAVLRRNGLPEKHRERFVFLYSDEAQETVNSYDAEFLSVCRQSKACAVYLTQTLPNYYAKMSRDDAHSLVGKFNTHLYGANACPETNEYAARMIGKVIRRRSNYSRGTSNTITTGSSEGGSESIGHSFTSGTSSSSGSNGSYSSGSSSSSTFTTGSSRTWSINEGKSTGHSENAGYSESMEYLIEPGEFARNLKTGGSANAYEVTGVWFQTSRVFEATGRNVLLARFKQR